MYEGGIYQHNRMVATGNLSWIDWLRVVEYIWHDTHPDIPLVAEGGKEVDQYPLIVYRLDFRNPLESENKPRYRESIATAPTDQAIINKGQRFNNFTTFTVYTLQDPHLAEAIIEQLENFMIEFTPVFKQLGLSDFFYGRRSPDTEDTRPGGITRVERSVTYNAITEKIIQIDYNKLQTFSINVQTYLENNPITYSVADSTPSSFTIINQTAAPNANMIIPTTALYLAQPNNQIVVNPSVTTSIVLPSYITAGTLPILIMTQSTGVCVVSTADGSQISGPFGFSAGLNLMNPGDNFILYCIDQVWWAF